MAKFSITIKRNVKWLILALLVIGVIVFTYYHFNVVEGAAVKCDNSNCNKALNRYRKKGFGDYPVKLWNKGEKCHGCKQVKYPKKLPKSKSSQLVRKIPKFSLLTDANNEDIRTNAHAAEDSTS